MEWQLQKAKSQFSELVQLAQIEAQIVTVRGEHRAVVMSVEEYERLIQQSKGDSLAHFLSHSPLAEAVQSGELMLARDDDTGREVDF